MGVQTRRRSLLLLEDDPHLAPMVAELLADHYDVTVVGDGQRALQLAGDGQFDVLVLDRRVPSVDGVEVVRRLRALHVRTPALLLTAQAAASEMLDGFDAGADDYLAKPYEFDELLARLQALIRNHADRADATEVVDRSLPRAGRLGGSASQDLIRNSPDHAQVPPTSRLLSVTSSTAVRVAQVSAMFWAIKGLSTALGESTSDYLVFAVNPVLAVLGTFVLFVVVLAIQLTRGRYTPWAYWSAVVMVGIFGTMAADVVHVVLHVPYLISSLCYGLALAAVFWTWWRVEGTLSVHAVTTSRRELFYWAAVAATFATGTAVGDLSAITWHLGYAGSIVAFAVAICVPAAGYRWWRWDAVTSFWIAYVLTRPLGASVADWTGKPATVGGLGIGDGPTSLAFVVLIIGMVTLLSRRATPAA